MRVLGTKSTTYSAPRYSSVWPRCRPKPFTSVTVMPETPSSERAARTSSSLKGLMIAVINFIRDSAAACVGPQLGCRPNPITIRLKEEIMISTILILGGGQAAAQAIDTLRRQGYEGRIVLVGDE